MTTKGEELVEARFAHQRASELRSHADHWLAKRDGHVERAVELGATQTEIAAKLELTQQAVSLMLKRHHEATT